MSASMRANGVLYICQVPGCEQTWELLCPSLPSWAGAADEAKVIRTHEVQHTSNVL